MPVFGKGLGKSDIYMDFAIRPRTEVKRHLGNGVYADPYPTYDQPLAGIRGVGVDLEKRVRKDTLPVRYDAPNRLDRRAPISYRVVTSYTTNATNLATALRVQVVQGIQELRPVSELGRPEDPPFKPKRKPRAKNGIKAGAKAGAKTGVKARAKAGPILYPAPQHRTDTRTDTPLSEIEETEHWG